MMQNSQQTDADEKSVRFNAELTFHLKKEDVAFVTIAEKMQFSASRDNGGKTEVLEDLGDSVEEMADTSEYGSVEIAIRREDVHDEILENGVSPEEVEAPGIVTRRDIEQIATDWHGIELLEVRYTDHIEGVDGEVLVDTSSHLFSANEVDPVLEQYIEQNEIDSRVTEVDESPLQLAVETLLRTGLDSVISRHQVNPETGWFETDENHNLLEGPEDLNLKDTDFRWIDDEHDEMHYGVQNEYSDEIDEAVEGAMDAIGDPRRGRKRKIEQSATVRIMKHVPLEVAEEHYDRLTDAVSKRVDDRLNGGEEQ